MSKIKDIKGQVFGKLKVLERDMTKTGSAAYWICQCECGKVISVRGTYLRSGKKIDCGCGYKERRINTKDTTSLLGKTFGKLTVIERDLKAETGHHIPSKWICKCECGKIISVTYSNLVLGKTKSCGCLKTNKITQKNTADLTGLKFGALTPLKSSFNKHPKDGTNIWLCQCDCGKMCYKSVSQLRQNVYPSCGCQTNSKGEQIIEDILIANNIQYSKQQTFFDLRGKNKSYLRFDFAIFENNQIVRLIEFDGEQHYNPSSQWYTKEGVERDQIKNEYAKEHNIPLVRIPYSAIKILSLDILLGDKYLL